MNWDYIAGFFDGEGCVHITSTVGKAPNIRITMSQLAERREVLDGIQAFLSRMAIASKIEVRPNSRSDKPIANLLIRAATSQHLFCMGVQNLCIVKRDKVAQAFEVLNTKLANFADWQIRLEKAIYHYTHEGSSLDIRKMYGICHVTLMKHLRLRGISPRSRSESSHMATRKRSAEYVKCLRERVQQLNNVARDKRNSDLAGAARLYVEGESIRRLSMAYGTNYPRMRGYLIWAGVHKSTPRKPVKHVQPL